MMMNTRIKAFAALWLGLVALLTVCAQAPAADAKGDYVVRVLTNDASDFPLVRTTVTVTDSTGAAVSGLAADEFTITENDWPVEGHDCTQQRPGVLAVALVIDCSGSMEGARLEAARAAATSFVRRMSAMDLCAVNGFASGNDDAATFTADKELAVRRLAALRAGGWTALYDAVFHGVQLLNTVTADRKAVVVLSDGKDNRSRQSLADVVTSANTNGIEVHTIGMRGADRASLGRLATETGGVSLFTASATDLAGCYRSIFGAITTTYELTYDSPNADITPPLRAIVVEVNSAPHSGETRLTYNVPSGLAGPTESSSTYDPMVVLLVGLAGINILLLVGVLYRRRPARTLIRQ